MTQLYGWWVWPLTTRSTSGSRWLDDVDDRAADTPVQPLMFSAVGEPPSWISTTMASTPCSCSSGTSALMVSASSWNVSPGCRPALTMSGVPSRVRPMKATLAPLKFLIA